MSTMYDQNLLDITKTQKSPAFDNIQKNKIVLLKLFFMHFHTLPHCYYFLSYELKDIYLSWSCDKVQYVLKYQILLYYAALKDQEPESSMWFRLSVYQMLQGECFSELLSSGDLAGARTCVALHGCGVQKDSCCLQNQISLFSGILLHKSG